MELNQLILALETEINENKDAMARIQKSNGDIWHYKYTDMVNETKFYESFVGMLKKIIVSPTCTANERKFLDTFIELDKKGLPQFCDKNERMFLDEIREKGKYNKYCNTVEIGETVIHNKDFQWALIEELVNE